MELDKIAALPVEVDETAVEDELMAYVSGRQWFPARAPWTIASLGAADWAFRRLAELRARMRDYDAEIALWTQAKGRLGNAAAWFEDRLSEWAVREREATPKIKTFATAHGTVSTRETKAKIDVLDEPAAIAWAKIHDPGAVKVTEDLLVSKLEVAHIGQLVVAWRAVAKETGVAERIVIDPPKPLTEEWQQAIVDQLGDAFVVDPVLADFVLDDNDQQVPGLGVRAGYISPTVTPIGL